MKENMHFHINIVIYFMSETRYKDYVFCFCADGPLVTLCRNCLCDMDFIQSALATKLLVSLIRNGEKQLKQRENLRDEAVDSVHALLMMLAATSGKSRQDKRAFQVLHSEMCNASRSSFSGSFFFVLHQDITSLFHLSLYISRHC